ncbi:unnamed protein product [Prunus armeniaca]
MQAANEAGSALSRQENSKGKELRNQDQGEGICPEDSPEKGWKPKDDIELIPHDPGQPDKEAQIGSCQNSNKKDRDEGIRPEGSLEKGWKPEEDVELVPLDPHQSDKKARIGSCLSPDEKMELTIFLYNKKDMFAWSPSDMPGIDPTSSTTSSMSTLLASPWCRRDATLLPSRSRSLKPRLTSS